jgi:hypothetical protein
VSYETNSLPGNKMYVVRLKKFSLQKVNNLTLVTFFTIGLVAPSTLIARLLKFKEVMFCGGDLKRRWRLLRSHNILYKFFLFS